MVSAGTSYSKHQHFADVLQTNALPQRGHFFCSNGRSLLFIKVELKIGKWKNGEMQNGVNNILHQTSAIRH